MWREWGQVTTTRHLFAPWPRGHGPNAPVRRRQLRPGLRPSLRGEGEAPPCGSLHQPRPVTCGPPALLEGASPGRGRCGFAHQSPSSSRMRRTIDSISATTSSGRLYRPASKRESGCATMSAVCPAGYSVEGDQRRFWTGSDSLATSLRTALTWKAWSQMAARRDEDRLVASTRCAMDRTVSCRRCRTSACPDDPAAKAVPKSGGHRSRRRRGRRFRRAVPAPREARGCWRHWPAPDSARRSPRTAG